MGNLGCFGGVAILAIAGSLGGFMADSHKGTVAGVVLLGVGVVLFWIDFVRQGRRERRWEDYSSKLKTDFEEWTKEVCPNSMQHEFVGWYMGGLPSAQKPHLGTFYFLTEKDFVFYVSLDDANAVNRWSVVARVPRNQVREVEILDHSQITQKFKVGAILALGLAGLGLQEENMNEKYYSIIHCVDSDAVNLDLVFRHSNVDPFNKFGSFRQPFVEPLKRDERKCPICAEIIKSEAVKCRFCGAELTSAT